MGVGDFSIFLCCHLETDLSPNYHLIGTALLLSKPEISKQLIPYKEIYNIERKKALVKLSINRCKLLTYL